MPNKPTRRIVVDGVELWRCSRCKQALTPDAYTSNNPSIYSYCRPCNLHQAAQWKRDRKLAGGIGKLEIRSSYLRCLERVRVYAVAHEMSFTGIVEQAVTEYFERLPKDGAK